MLSFLFVQQMAMVFNPSVVYKFWACKNPFHGKNPTIFIDQMWRSNIFLYDSNPHQKPHNTHIEWCLNLFWQTGIGKCRQETLVESSRSLWTYTEPFWQGNFGLAIEVANAP